MIERRFRARRTGRGDRKARAIQHDTGTRLLGQATDCIGRDGILQARNIERQCRNTPFAQRADQRIDRGKCARLVERPVEHDRRGGAIRLRPPPIVQALMTIDSST